MTVLMLFWVGLRSGIAGKWRSREGGRLARERRKWLGGHVVALPQYSAKIAFLCRLPATKILSLSQQIRIFCRMDFRKECLPYNRAVFLHW
jgi:hypothetical protein